MAQSITGTAMGRVNRRFLVLALILAALSGVLAYTAFSRSGGDTTVGETPVVVARAAIPAGVEITADMVELRQVSQNAVGSGAFTSVESVVGQVTRFPIEPAEHVLASKVVGGINVVSNDVLSNILEAGQRGMAIKTELVIGAGGLVLPGDRVDIYWIPSDPDEDTSALLLAENVEVVSVAQEIVEIPPTAPGVQQDDAAAAAQGGERIRGSEAPPNPEAATVTLMLTPEQALNVFCGEEGGVIRLAVRAFGDDSGSGIEQAGCLIRGNENQP